MPAPIFIPKFPFAKENITMGRKSNIAVMLLFLIIFKINKFKYYYHHLHRYEKKTPLVAGVCACN